MGLTTKFSAVALGCSIALVGCGGSGSITDTNATTADVDPAALFTQDTNVAASNGTFFSAEDGVRFASQMGQDLSSVVGQALGSSSAGFADAAPDNDPTSGIFNDETSVSQCDSGSVSSSIGTNVNDELENASFVFNNCVIDGQTTSGSMSIAASATGGSEVLTIEFADFGSTGPEGDSFIDGGVRLSVDENLSSSISGTQLTMVADGETTVFSNFALETSFNDDAGTATVGGQATIASSVDGTIQFSIDPAFTGPADGYPTVGILGMVHSDGSSLAINADTGDDATYAYVVNGNGSVTSGVGMWADESFQSPVLANGTINNFGF